MIKKNKILLFWFILLGCLTYSYAQETVNTREVETVAHKMFVDLNNLDYDAILDMTHPKVFDLVSKEQMKTLFMSMFEGNDEFSVEIPKTIPDYKVSDVYKGKENNLEYAFVSYDMSMKMTFNNQEFDDEGKEMMINMMKVQGMDVAFLSNSTMDVLMRDRVTILLKEDATENNWVMINYDPDSPITYQLLSTDLLEKTKQYRQNLLLDSKKKSDN